MESAIKIFKTNLGDDHPETIDALSAIRHATEHANSTDKISTRFSPPTPPSSSSGPQNPKRPRRTRRGRDPEEPSSYLWMAAAVGIISAVAATSAWLSFKILKYKQ
jgi:hypothetical protein